MIISGIKQSVVARLSAITGGMTPSEIGGAIKYSKLPFGFLDVDAVIAIEGDSIQALGAAGAQADWAVSSFSRGCGRRPIGFNDATGGETAEQMTSQIADVLANSPELVYFGAGTNDIKNGRTADQITRDISVCVYGYLNGGAKYVYLFKVLPRVYGANEFTEAQLEIMRSVNNYIDTLASSDNRIACEGSVDWFAADYTDDGTHPNWRGAYERARRNKDSLNAFWNDRTVIFAPYSSDNILKSLSLNPEMEGSTGSSNAVNGTITGDIPSNWLVAQEADVDTVVSLEPDFFGIGLHGVRFTSTGTGLISSDKFIKIRTSPNPAINGLIGDLYEAYCCYHVDKGHFGISRISIEFATLKTVNSDDTAAITGGDEMSGVMRSYSTEALTSNTTSAEFSLRIYARGPTGSGGDVSFSVVFGVPHLIKIN